MFKPVKLELENFISHQNSVFEFESDKPLLLVGDNRDDSSQKGNGSGKSAIVEAISYLITGSTIRSIRDKELIRDGEKNCKIKLILKNDFLDKTLYIERSLFETKSSTCLVKIDDEVVSKSSINEYNSFILEYLGISKEDFLNFYLVTKERYQSFFSSGDVYKKNTIDRFSNAHLIDKVDLKSKYSEIEGELTSIQLEIEKVKGAIEVLQKPQEFNIEEVNKEIEILNTEIDKLISEHSKMKIRKEETEGERLVFEKRVKEYELEIEKKRTDFNSKLDSFKKDSKLILQEIEEELSKESLELTELLQILEKNFDSKQREYEVETLNLRTERRGNESSLRKIEVKLEGEISCPKCEEKFLVNDSETSILELEELKVLLKQEIEKILQKENTLDLNYQTEVEQYSKDKSDVKRALSEVEQKFQEKKDSSKSKLRELEEKLELDFQTEIETLKRKSSLEQIEVNKLNLKLNEVTNTLDLIKGQGETKRSLLKSKESLKENFLTDKTKEQLSSKNIELKDLTSRLESKQQELTKNKTWEIRFKKFKSYLSNLSLKSITQLTNRFLSELGSNLEVDIDGYRELTSGQIKEEITCSVIRDGYLVSSYGRYSAGERGRIDVCTILALQQLINMNSPSGGLNLLICDEILDSIDSLGIESLINSFKNLERNIILVSQNEIQSLSSNTIIVRKENQISKIIRDVKGN